MGSMLESLVNFAASTRLHNNPQTYRPVRIASHTPHLSVPLRHYVRVYVKSESLLVCETVVFFAACVTDATVSGAAQSVSESVAS
jgi:hypothetical protein